MRLAIFVLVITAASHAGAEYRQEPVVQGGTISGRITFNGRQPIPKMIQVTKDPKVCGTTREEDSWIVAEDGGVENVVVYLVNVASGKKFESSMKPMLDQRGCHYHPHVQVVPLHAALQVKSSDPILHNVHSFLNGTTVINFAMPPQAGLVLSKKLDKPGGQQLKCDVHSFMRGGVFVAENPYYAVTTSDGAFQIKDVPAGTYTIATWHEEGGPLADSVIVSPSGQVTWNGKIR
ncbi:MAG: hypothetical protein AUH41_07340 [Gemmatimonadetes bacterium 13_1_40CM_66_11]|nr:MAG: hypothetical protein AUH41_07340 [Gemmatimonadetes bacterium 13_1_40CM_66_11]OLD33991.1 MAG: hypothetical protein AUI19_03695 [Myxococcales bacterium 13_1_40CM_2_68_15]